MRVESTLVGEGPWGPDAASIEMHGLDVNDTLVLVLHFCVPVLRISKLGLAPNEHLQETKISDSVLTLSDWHSEAPAELVGVSNHQPIFRHLKEQWILIFQQCTAQIQNASGQLARCGAMPQACKQLSAALVQAATSAGCRYKPAAAASSARPRRDHRPFYDRECRDLKWLYQHTRSGDPEMARILRRKYPSLVRRKCWQYRQQQTHVLLREIRRRPQDFWQKLNGPPTPLRKPLQQHSKWQQYFTDFCAPLPAGPPQPSTSPQEDAQQAASDLTIPISPTEVESAAPAEQQ